MTTPLLQLSNDLSRLADAHGSSVARVEGSSHGASALVFSSDGVLIAPSHAIESDDGLKVTLADGRTLDATLVGRDHGSDLAVLRVDAKDLVAPTFAAAADIRVATLAIALARPGRTLRAAFGAVGVYGEGFRTRSGGKIDRWLQLDRSLPWGFSGAAVFDAQGRALGLATPGLLRRGSLIVPVETITRVVTAILAHGQVQRGYLGVGVYPVSLPAPLAAQLGRSAGVVLVAVEADGPAHKAGLGIGDVILSVDGERVEGPRELSSVLGDRAGKSVVLALLRAGAALDVTVQVGTRS